MTIDNQDYFFDDEIPRPWEFMHEYRAMALRIDEVDE